MSRIEYHCIGRGGCGSVWALPITATTPTSTTRGSNVPFSTETQEAEVPQETPQQFPTPHVLKRADGDTWRSLPNNLAMHRHFLSSTSTTTLPFLVPHSYTMLSASDPEYPRNPPADSAPCETYITERIPRLPLSIRSMLINRYGPDALRASVRRSKKDEDCLVRLYCGRRRGKEERARQKRFFTLRNYGIVGEGAGELLLVARIDANDCEWMFGLPRGTTKIEVVTEDEKRMMADTELFNINGEGGKCEAMAVWMLDFDCVQRMTMDQQGVQQAVDAFYRNDSYFPRPWTNEYTEEDGRMWGVFRKAFLDESGKILKPPLDVIARRGSEEEAGDLAWLWIKGVEQEGSIRAAGREVKVV